MRKSAQTRHGHGEKGDENGDLHIQFDCPDHSMLNSGRTKTSAEETEKMGTKRTKKNSELQAL